MAPRPPAHHSKAAYTRRRLLVGGVAASVGALGWWAVREADAAYHDMLAWSGLDQGACNNTSRDVCGAPGANITGTFFSSYRHTKVTYRVGYPPGHGPGSEIPLVFMLHGFGGNHASGVAGYSPAQAAALQRDGVSLPPVAIVTMDGGQGYWHPHPDDDPMGMVVYELLPMMQRQGLGRRPGSVGVMGLSMGGYGAIAFAENHPGIFRAVAAISPAIFVTYEHVHYVNPGAYSSAAEFARYDAVTHTAPLRDVPLRVASGASDPFHWWVEDFEAALPSGSPAQFFYPPGAHNQDFFQPQAFPSLAFLTSHLASS